MKPGFDRDDGSCLGCDAGHAVERKNSKNGQKFYGCSEFPKCYNSMSLYAHDKPMGCFLLSGDDILEIEYDVYRSTRDWG